MTSKAYFDKKLNSFYEQGFCELKNILNKDVCKSLYKEIRDIRNWDKNLFLSEKDFKKNPQMTKTNPGKGICNLVDKYDLSFIEKNTNIKFMLQKILGDNYELMLSKFVVAVPKIWMPKYLKIIDKKSLISNFGPYIKKKFRDVTYFRGIDYHMDSIDWNGKSNKFITMYIYLNDVDLSMSPLNVIKKSHTNGHTSFPHFIRDIKDKDYLKYSVDNLKYNNFKKKTLIGKTGTVYFWTSNTLHGTRPSISRNENFRISLRYLFKKTTKKKVLIDKMVIDNLVGETRKLKKNYVRVLK